MRRAVAGIVICAVVAFAAPVRAMDVELRDGELALSLSYPLRIDAMFVTGIGDVPMSFGAHLSPEAEGGGLSIGVRPLLASVDDYRLIWASRAGPVVYGRDGASGGLEAVTELLNVFGTGTVRVAITPRVDFAGAWGDQSAWRLRTALVIALGIVENLVSAWVQGELGYTFGGEGGGAFRVGASLVLSVRPGWIQ